MKDGSAAVSDAYLRARISAGRVFPKELMRSEKLSGPSVCSRSRSSSRNSRSYDLRILGRYRVAFLQATVEQHAIAEFVGQPRNSPACRKNEPSGSGLDLGVTRPSGEQKAVLDVGPDLGEIQRLQLAPFRPQWPRVNLCFSTSR